MRLIYRTRKRDIFAGRVLTLFYNRTLLSISVLCVALVTYRVCEGVVVQLAFPFNVVYILVAFGLATLTYLAMQSILLGVLTFFSKDTGVLGEHTLEIKDEGLEESTSVNRGLHRWNSSFRIRKGLGYVWIFPVDGRYFLIRDKEDLLQGDLAGFIELLRLRLERATADTATTVG